MTTKKTTKDAKPAKDSKPAKDIYLDNLITDDDYRATILEDDYRPLVNAISLLMDGKDLPEYDQLNGTDGMLQQYKKSWSYSKRIKGFKKEEMLASGTCSSIYGPNVCKLKRICDKLPLSIKQMSWLELDKNGLYQNEFEQLITLFTNTVRLLKLLGYDEFSEQLASIIKIAVSRSPYYCQDKMGLLIQYCTGLLQLLCGEARIYGGCDKLSDCYGVNEYIKSIDERRRPLYRLYFDDGGYLSVSYLPLLVKHDAFRIATNASYRLSCEFSKPLDQPREFNNLAIRLNNCHLTENDIAIFFDQHRLTGDVNKSMLQLHFNEY